MQVKSMLEKAFPEETYPNTILHSDQGWQYQHEAYHHFLDSKVIRPSMSRKGTSTANGMMESFFGILKTEMFYGFEKTFKSLDQLEQAMSSKLSKIEILTYITQLYSSQSQGMFIVVRNGKRQAYQGKITELSIKEITIKTIQKYELIQITEIIEISLVEVLDE